MMAAMLVALAAPLAAQEHTLSSAVRDVAKRHSSLVHMSTAYLSARLGADREVVLFDVREESEHAVSHLEGAIRVDPGIWRSTFLSRFRHALGGKTVVFYCSVGVRSSALAESVKNDLISAGAKVVANLEGGIFAWHNEKRALVNSRGPTTYVHPYDTYWGRLLTRPELARTTIIP
jgi:rhodanese-related sulfurtransferase